MKSETNRTLLRVKKTFNFKQHVQKTRWLLNLSMLLTLSVGEMVTL